MNSLSWPSERRKVSPLLPPQQISTTDVRALKEDVDMEDTEILEKLPISAYKLLYYMDGGEFSNRNLPELATQCHHARNWKPFLDHITKGSKMASMLTLSAPPSVNDTQEYSEDDLATAAFGSDLASMKGWEIAASDICKDRLLLQALRGLPQQISLMKDIERMLGSMRQVAPPAERPHQEYNDAFNKTYLGQDYQALNCAIRRMDGLKYTRILPIVQSSGMGKSKLMLKISEEIVVLQACICGNAGS